MLAYFQHRINLLNSKCYCTASPKGIIYYGLHLQRKQNTDTLHCGPEPAGILGRMLGLHFLGKNVFINLPGVGGIAQIDAWLSAIR
jgi:hypothetical protein